MTYFTQFQKNNYTFSDDITKRVTNISHYTEIFSRVADDISFYTYYNARPGERFDNISNELYDTPDYYWTIPILNDTITNTWRDTIRSVPALESYVGQKYPGKAIIIEPTHDIIGSFVIGEYLLYSNSDPFILRGKYPTLNYLHADPIDSIDESAEPPEETEENEIVGFDSGSILPVRSIVDRRLAPANFTDSEQNTVPWYVENTVPTSIHQTEVDVNETKGRLKVIRPQYIRDVVERFEEEMRASE